MRTMELSKDYEVGGQKWCGLMVYKKKLFASLYDSNSILVIDTETDTTYGINCGERSGDKSKWS